MGFCSAQAVLDEAEIHEIVVLPERRQQGVGRALLLGALEVARARGCRSAHLEVRRSNAAARALYEGLGFEVVRVRRGYYRDPVEDALLFSRALEPVV